jgi:hypothetical protein
MNTYYCYKQTQSVIEGPSNHLVDNLQYNKDIVPKFNLLSRFALQFVDDTL